MGVSIASLLLRIMSQKGDATKDVEELAVALDTLDHKKAEATAGVDTKQESFDQLVLELEAFGKKNFKAKASVETDVSQLDLFAQKIDSLGREATKTFKGRTLGFDPGSFSQMLPHGGQLTIDAELDSTKAKAEAISLHEQLKLILRDEHVNVDIDKEGRTTKVIGDMIGAFGSLASAGAGIGGVFAKMGESLGGITVNIGMFGLSLGPVLAIILALAFAIGVSLVGAFVAVASSAVLATIAIAALGVALLGALAPIALIAIPAILAFGKVFQALQASQQDQTKATRDATRATAQKAQADSEARRFAQAHADAERSLADAMKNAAETQTAGFRDVATAQQRAADVQKAGLRSVQDATQAAADAEKSAYREMQDAIEAVADSIRGLARSKLGVEQARLNFSKAKQDLADFRKQLGLTGDNFDAMFKSFTDVAFDPTKLNQALAGIQAPGGGVTGGDKLQLEQLILNVKDARLSEKDATNSVTDAQTKLNRARQDEKPFLDDGIKGSKNYASALTALADAQTSAAKANKDALKSIADAQINADKNNQNAARSVADARRNLARVESDHAFALKQMHDQQAAANAQADATRTKTGRLSAENRKLLDSLKGLIGAFKEAFGPAINAFIGGFISGFKLLGGVLRNLKGPMTDLGKVMGTAVVDFFKALSSPGSQKLFVALIDGAKTLVPLISKIFAPMLDFMSKIAVAAMPILVLGFQAVAKWLGDLDKNTSVKDISDFITKQLVPSLNAWIDLAIKLGPAFFDFIKQAAPSGIDFLKWVGGVADKFLKWEQSKKGREEIKHFFKDTIPNVERFLGFIIGIIGILVDIGDWVSNAWHNWDRFWRGVGGIFFDIFNWVGQLISTLTGGNPLDLLFTFITSIPGVAQAIDFFKVGFDIISGIIDGITSGNLIDAFIKILDNLWKDVKNFLGISSPSTLFFGLGVDIIQGLWNGITSLAIDFATWLWNNIIRPAVTWLVGLPGQFFNFGKNIISNLINGLTSLVTDFATWLWNNVIKPAVDWLVGLPVQFFNYGKNIIKNLLDGLTSIVIDFATWIFNHVINPVVTWLDKLPTTFFNLGKNIVTSLWDGLTSIGFNFGGWVYDHIPGPLKSILGMHSPSKVMMQIGMDIGKGLEIGIRASAVGVQQAATRTLAAPIVAAGSSASGGGRGGITIQHQDVNLPAAPGGDQMGDPRHQAALFAREMRRRGWR